MREEEARLREHLDRHPADFASRLVLADLLEERGDEAGARCQRWLGLRRAYPDDGLPGRWRWEGGLHATLPPEVAAHLPSARRPYRTRAEAEAALAAALARLEEQARGA